jgi:hypothetical protein
MKGTKVIMQCRLIIAQWGLVDPERITTVRKIISLVSVILPAVLLAVFGFALSASAQVSNYVSLDTVVSSSASSFASNLPAYILAGLGIFVALVLFRFGVRLLRRWVH